MTPQSISAAFWKIHPIPSSAINAKTGELREYFEDLYESARDGKLGFWSVPAGAKENDWVAFYIMAPIKEIRYVGRISSEPTPFPLDVDDSRIMDMSTYEPFKKLSKPMSLELVLQITGWKTIPQRGGSIPPHSCEAFNHEISLCLGRTESETDRRQPKVDNDITLSEYITERRYWRMAMKAWDRGPDLFPACRARGIAAAGFRPAGDCTSLTEKEFNTRFSSEWNKRWPGKPFGTARKLLFNLVFEMKPGDIIYVKDGTRIVGKGIITQGYKYDQDIMKGEKSDFPHYVSVDWEKDFPEIPIKLGSEPTTILELKKERLELMLQAEATAKGLSLDQLLDEMNRTSEAASLSSKELAMIVAEEGLPYVREALFRARNKEIIQQKKAQSNHRCEVCGMRYLDVYGIGADYIVAHHLNPIGSRAGSSSTTLDDIALVCANCHAMLHQQDPPYKIAELKNMLEAKSETR